MVVQTSENIDTTPFILEEMNGHREDKATLLTDAGRTTDLAQYTLMAQISASEKWVPFTAVAAVNGTAIPTGIFMGDAIAFADIVAGDVLDLPIVTFGAKFDSAKLIIENSLTLDSILAVGTIHERTVKEALLTESLIPSTVDCYGAYENA